MAVTELSRDELGRLGYGLRGSYLVQQAGYTRGIAAEDGQSLLDMLPAGYLDETAAAQAIVEKAQGDREIMQAESEGLTSEQDKKVRALKVWRRKVAKRASRQKRLGRTVSDALMTIGRADGVPALVSQATGMLAELEANVEPMGGAPAQALVDEGKKLVADLSKTDAEQEVARLAGLPKKVQDYFVAKGTLYVALKVINDAGQELHADDPKEAAKYNLRILHRRGGARTTTPDAPAPA